MRYHHVDVFSNRPYSGNSLTVFPEAAGLNDGQRQRITQELRHFESVFLTREEAADHSWHVRVHDLVTELDFAGHPLVGAACVLHALHGTSDRETWTLHTRARTVQLTTHRGGTRRWEGVLDQGPAEFGSGPKLREAGKAAEVASWFSLDAGDLDPGLPAEVVSTGLRYLVLPVRGDALARARVARDLTAPLAELGAQFAYVLDAAGMEGRHWNNDGVLEDVATGSGAGCAAAYLRRHDRIGDGTKATLHQGRFTGRPSQMTITAHGKGERIRSVGVGGDVVLLGEGRLAELPS